jgi:hypothetical protein
MNSISRIQMSLIFFWRDYIYNIKSKFFQPFFILSTVCLASSFEGTRIELDVFNKLKYWSLVLSNWLNAVVRSSLIFFWKIGHHWLCPSNPGRIDSWRVCLVWEMRWSIVYSFLNFIVWFVEWNRLMHRHLIPSKLIISTSIRNGVISQNLRNKLMMHHLI